MSELPTRSLAEIRRIKREVEADLMKRRGVTGVDVGYRYVGGKKTDVLAIRIYVEKKRDVPEKEVIPRHIENIPTDVIERRFVLHRAQADAADNNATQAPREPPRQS